LSEKIIENIDFVKFSDYICIIINRFIFLEKNPSNVIPVEEDIIIYCFEILTSCLIPYSAENEFPLVQSNIIQRNYERICLTGLTHRSQNIRRNYLNSLLTSYTLCILFRKLESIEYLNRYFIEVTIESFNNLSEHSHEILQLSSNFSKEFFAFIIKILEFIFDKNKDSDATGGLINKDEIFKFLLNIAKIIKQDIKNERDINLDKNLFIGFLKILSKVSEIKSELKEILMNSEFDLMSEIINNIIFHNAHYSIINKIKKLDSEFINPEIINDVKESRNSDEELRYECFNFILALLGNSLKNYEIFFKMNIGIFQSSSDSDESFTQINASQESETTSRDSPRRGRQQQQKQKKESQFKPMYLQSNNIKAEGYVGIRNLGCICYMNSVLQQLFMVPTLRNAILQISDGKAPNTDNPYDIDNNFFHQIQKMFSYLSLSNREDYIPYGFCYSFKDWEGNPTNLSIQQDVQ